MNSVNVTLAILALKGNNFDSLSILGDNYGAMIFWNYSSNESTLISENLLN